MSDSKKDTNEETPEVEGLGSLSADELQEVQVLLDDTDGPPDYAAASAIIEEGRLRSGAAASKREEEEEEAPHEETPDQERERALDLLKTIYKGFLASEKKGQTLKDFVLKSLREGIDGICTTFKDASEEAEHPKWSKPELTNPGIKRDDIQHPLIEDFAGFVKKRRENYDQAGDEYKREMLVVFWDVISLAYRRAVRPHPDSAAEILEKVFQEVVDGFDAIKWEPMNPHSMDNTPEEKDRGMEFVAPLGYFVEDQEEEEEENPSAKDDSWLDDPDPSW